MILLVVHQGLAEGRAIMARKAFHVVDIAEILMHWHAGRSVREIANNLGVARNTVARYVAAGAS
jgi:DNA-binding transcriptional regulator LsrR (DeoR family)